MSGHPARHQTQRGVRAAREMPRRQAAIVFRSSYCGRTARQRNAEKERTCPLRGESSGGQDIGGKQQVQGRDVGDEGERRRAAEDTVLDLRGVAAARRLTGTIGVAGCRTGVMAHPRHAGHAGHAGHVPAEHSARKPVGAELEREEPAGSRHESDGHERTSRKPQAQGRQSAFEASISRQRPASGARSGLKSYDGDAIVPECAMVRGRIRQSSLPGVRTDPGQWLSNRRSG